MFAKLSPSIILKAASTHIIALFFCILAWLVTSELLWLLFIGGLTDIAGEIVPVPENMELINTELYQYWQLYDAVVTLAWARYEVKVKKWYASWKAI